MIEITSALAEMMNSTASYETAPAIAATILSNLHVISELDIRDLAQKARVSPASVSRFIRKLGFDSYQEFKSETISQAPLRSEYIERQHPLNVDAAAGEDYTVVEKRRVLDALDECERLIRDLAPSSRLNALAQDMVSHERVCMYCGGFPSAIARHVQTELAAHGKPILIVDRILERSFLTPDSLAVVFDPTGFWISCYADSLESYMTRSHERTWVISNRRRAYAWAEELVLPPFASTLSCRVFVQILADELVDLCSFLLRHHGRQG